MVSCKAARHTNETERELANREVAYGVALEAVVLLENDGALPIRAGRVALYGSGARQTIKGGTGSGEVNERHSISVEEGLQSAGFVVTTKPWLDAYDAAYHAARETYGKRVARRLRRLDANAMIEVFTNPFRYPFGRPITGQDVESSDTGTCIYVIARQAGEGGDRRLEHDDYHLSHIERDNIRRCGEVYERTIVVLNVGSAFDTNFVREIPGVGALVLMGHLGSEGGRALADLLGPGPSSPSGRLTDSWAKLYDDIPFAREFGYLNGDLSTEEYREGIYVGYRYFDRFDVAPAYPFGYGLGYTSFSIAVTDVELAGTVATVRARIENTGGSPAKEVAQIYVSCPQTGLPKEMKVLAGFAKTGVLGPGQAEEVAIDIDLHSLASYDERGSRYILDAGEYVVRAGSSSRHTTACAVLALDEQVVLSQHRPICPSARPISGLSPPSAATDDLGDLPRLKVDGSAFVTMEYAYGEPPPVSDPLVVTLMKGLSPEQLVHVVNGIGIAFMIKGGGTKHFSVPGASGSTTEALINEGVPNVLLCDGPAGLRLQQHSVLYRRGRLKPVGAPIDIMNYLPKVAQRLLQGNPARGDSLYQFATAFPVGTALAQTWNLALVEEVGVAVATEMVEYGVTYWLAPGMNIHRNPLCGRNFEYYSEDPYLSGKMAVALTRGVQATDGCYVTVKHFVANECEDNRNRSNSIVGERALREIYLRPFEIAVKEAAPKALMTSYNLVNGVYTSNSHDLCTKVLRNEWGFDGVVMTDWESTGKGLADTGTCIKVGNDLIMAGGRSERKRVMEALESGAISEADLRRCAANVLRSILGSQAAIDDRNQVPPRR